MAYIRYGTMLPSGKTSHSYVIGDPDCLISFNMGIKPIPYTELITLFRTKSYEQIKRIIQKRLKLTVEENELVCETLFEEHKAGEWDTVPQWSIDYNKNNGNERILGKKKKKDNK